jgi:mercuric ion transport protein
MDPEITQTSLAAAPSHSEVAPSTGRAGLAAAGGMLGALASMSCCVLPVALFTLGISGAWISNLTALAPYQPIFFAATAGFLGAGYYLVYRQPKAACADGTCSRPLPSRIVKGILGAATLLVLAAAAFDYLAPVLLGA